MSAETVQPLIEPDAEQMLRHLEHLFGGYLDGCQEGRIELAWTDGRDGKLRHAAIFGTDELDALVERAARENRLPGQNVYIGQALRKPDTPPFGRCTDADFFAMPALYTDIDDDVLGAAREQYRDAGCPPTAVVVTGRKPHTRAQLLWRLESPERDPDICRSQNLALSLALGGDRTVVNPSRVLRLGGSIAWPAKPGRVLERTEFHLFDDDRPKVYLGDQLARAFPPQPAAAPKPDDLAADGTRPSSAATPWLRIGSEFDGVSVDACLAAVRAGDHWHDNLVRLTGHWIARGWSDAEILTAAQALTLAGYTVDQTRREVAPMIAGGRAKWNIPNPEHALTQSALAPFVLRPIGRLDPAQRPPRDWLVRHRMMRKHTTVTAAAPGVGKSTLTIEEAVSLASGRDFLGFGIGRPHKVAVINNEETRDELERRIEVTCVHFGVPFESIAETFFLHSGIDAEKFVVAVRGKDDTVIVQPRVAELTQFVAETGIDLVVIDPFAQAHRIPEKENDEIEQVMIALRDIAARGNAAVHVVHHTRKPPAGTAHQAGDIFAVRGGGAIVGDAHFVFTLADMGRDDAESLGIAEADRKRFVRLDDAKGKLAPPSGAQWFERLGVCMPYGLLGEEVGVLVPKQFDDGATAVSAHRATEILNAIDERWQSGNPFSASPQSDRYVVPMMVQRFGLAKKSARSLLADWVSNAMVRVEVYDTDAKAKGLRVLKWPG